MPLNGLRPTDGPVIRILLAYIRSQAFAQMRLSSTAHHTIQTILASLWAFWSDIQGVPHGAYADFCGGMKALMPRMPPEGGDVTETIQMRSFVSGLWDRLRPVSVARGSQGTTWITNTTTSTYRHTDRSMRWRYEMLFSK